MALKIVSPFPHKSKKYFSGLLVTHSNNDYTMYVAQRSGAHKLLVAERAK